MSEEARKKKAEQPTDKPPLTVETTPIDLHKIQATSTPEIAPVEPLVVPPLPEKLKCKILSPIRRSRTDRLEIGDEAELTPEEILEFVSLQPPAIAVLPVTPKVNLNTAQAREIAVKLGISTSVAQLIIDLRSATPITDFEQLGGIWQLDIDSVRDRAQL